MTTTVGVAHLVIPQNGALLLVAATLLPSCRLGPAKGIKATTERKGGGRGNSGGATFSFRAEFGGRGGRGVACAEICFSFVCGIVCLEYNISYFFLSYRTALYARFSAADIKAQKKKKGKREKKGCFIIQ